ncbi:MAG: alkaline phosphatase family protein [Armatimonadota bacterium]|nr:alkaline phosphatase family protein [Armatimonadota bacterium]MDR7520637.1 alkaline phosphatase family protein [Armatimonadota bacterium]MDR7548535.1 alkaline phosphatase family protein [Armatimonadota bacterium]
MLALILSLVLPASALVFGPPAVVGQPGPAARAQHVLLISLDGARPDGLRAAGIGPLLEESSYSMTAHTTRPPVTLPSHMSMVSGVGPEKHGIRENDWRPGMPYPAVPTIFSIAKQAGLRTALFTQKHYVLALANPQFMDKVELVRWRPASLTADLVEAAAGYIRSVRPHLMLAHISEPDAVGHAEGWMSFAYLQGLRRSVAAVATFRQALRDAGIEAQTLVIITADHGGIDKDHRVLVPEVLTIPWIALGPGIKKGAALERSIMIYDTAPTVLHALGLPIPAGWDGRPVVEAWVSAPVMPVAAR